MSELVFMMGKFEARFPTDRQYATNHVWAREHAGVTRFGFTAYAVRLMLDVYFLDWVVAEGRLLSRHEHIGSIESKKAESELYAPVAGRLVRFNESLMDDPSAINADMYGRGWLFEMHRDGEALLSAEDYLEHLGPVWKITQRALKKQFS